MLIKMNPSELVSLPQDIYDANGNVQTPADYKAVQIATSKSDSDAIYILVDDNTNILSGLSESNKTAFEGLGLTYEEIVEIPTNYTQTIFGIKHKPYMTKKEILKLYLRVKIEEQVGDPLDLLTDLKNTQFFFQSLSARYIAVCMQIHQYTLNSQQVPQEIIDQFSALVTDYLPFTLSYAGMIDNDTLERTSDLKNRWLTRDGQIMKYINREKEIYQLVYGYNKLLGNNVDNI